MPFESGSGTGARGWSGLEWRPHEGEVDLAVPTVLILRGTLHAEVVQVVQVSGPGKQTASVEVEKIVS